MATINTESELQHRIDAKLSAQKRGTAHARVDADTRLKIRIGYGNVLDTMAALAQQHHISETTVRRILRDSRAETDWAGLDPVIAEGLVERIYQRLASEVRKRSVKVKPAVRHEIRQRYADTDETITDLAKIYKRRKIGRTTIYSILRGA